MVELGQAPQESKAPVAPAASDETAAKAATEAPETDEDPDDEEARDAKAAEDAERQDPKNTKPVKLADLLNSGALAPVDMSGVMQGSGIGGIGGLGLSGTGGSGGFGTGSGFGAGTGTVGRLGQGLGTGSKPPQVRMETPQTAGSLDPDIIRRVVRANFGRFRLCYENGLNANPKLEGKVTIQFVINTDGSVKSASNKQSTLSDQNVVQCVVRAFKSMSFPKPNNGIVMVTYPIHFSPGEKANPTPPPASTPAGTAASGAAKTPAAPQTSPAPSTP